MVLSIICIGLLWLFMMELYKGGPMKLGDFIMIVLLVLMILRPVIKHKSMLDEVTPTLDDKYQAAVSIESYNEQN